MNEPLWSTALSLRAQRKRLNIPAPTQSRSQRLHSFWSAPRMQDLWDNQCQNAGESKSDWLLFFTGSLREKSFKTGNKST